MQKIQFEAIDEREENKKKFWFKISFIAENKEEASKKLKRMLKLENEMELEFSINLNKEINLTTLIHSLEKYKNEKKTEFKIIVWKDVIEILKNAEEF